MERLGDRCGLGRGVGSGGPERRRLHRRRVGDREAERVDACGTRRDGGVDQRPDGVQMARLHRQLVQRRVADDLRAALSRRRAIVAAVDGRQLVARGVDAAVGTDDLLERVDHLRGRLRGLLARCLGARRRLLDGDAEVGAIGRRALVADADDGDRAATMTR